MKRLMQFLVILSCAAYAYDDPAITKAAINKSKQNCSLSVACLNPDGTITCQGPRGSRGNKGKKGNTGPTGATGATGAVIGCTGPSELFSNAFFMRTNTPICNISQFGECIPFAFCTYDPAIAACIPNWQFAPSTNPIPVGLNFTIPIDLDVTQPVTLVVHFLVIFNPSALGNQVNFQVEADYKTSGELVGVLPPATGFSETVLSGDFTVNQPLNFNDVLHISQNVSLNPALMTPGDWAFLSFIRVPPVSNEYGAAILFTTISFQYSRVCS
jgi:hypothetical protein